MLAGLGLRARLLAHVRCVPADICRALETGVHGINLYFGTSPLLRTYAHRRDVEAIVDTASACIALVRAAGREVRFGCEDAFRTPEADLLRICCALDEAGVDRLSLADTVGVATPRRVDELVRLVCRNVRAEIEFHGHDVTIAWDQKGGHIAPNFKGYAVYLDGKPIYRGPRPAHVLYDMANHKLVPAR